MVVPTRSNEPESDSEGSVASPEVTCQTMPS